MKKFFMIFSVLLCVMLFTAIAWAMENEPEEFRGIPWGAAQPKNSAAEENKWELMEIRKSDIDATTVYCRLLDEVSIGGVKISSASVEYHFLNSLGFARVQIRFEGRENIDRIRKACIADWGEPDSEMILKIKDMSDSVSLMWNGLAVTAMFYSRTYSSDKSPESGDLSIYLNNFYEAADKELEKNKQKESDS